MFITTQGYNTSQVDKSIVRVFQMWLMCKQSHNRAYEICWKRLQTTNVDSDRSPHTYIYTGIHLCVHVDDLSIDIYTYVFGSVQGCLRLPSLTL